MSINDILDIWLEDGKAEIQHKDLIEKIIERKNVQNRQAERYLAILRLEEKLEAIPKGPKNIFYKPTSKGWNNYLWLKEQSKFIGKYLADSLDKTISETKELNSRLYNRVWKEIGSNPKSNKAETSTEAFDIAMNHVLYEDSTKKELKTFYSHFHSLIRSCLQPLTEHTVFSRLLTEEELPEIIQEQVAQLIRAYMDIWDFVYKHPTVVSELEKIIEHENPERKTAKKIVQH